LEEPTLIGKGRMADVFAWGEGKILKLNHAQYSLLLAEMEFRNTRAVFNAGIPVPQPYDLIDYQGRHGIVFERIIGHSLLDELQARPWKLVPIARQLAELHALIHSKVTPENFTSQKAYLKQAIETSQVISEAKKQVVFKEMERLPDGGFLCHGDFHPGNILLSERGPIIIDWLTATTGDPLADICRTVMIFETVNPPETPFYMKFLLTLLRSLLKSVYVKHYLELHPASKDQIDRWRLPLVAARLREVENYPLEKKLLLEKMRELINSAA